MELLTNEEINKVVADFVGRYTNIHFKDGDVILLCKVKDHYELEIAGIPMFMGTPIAKKKLPRHLPNDTRERLVAVIGELVVWLRNRNRNIKSIRGRDKKEMAETNRENARKRWAKDKE